MLTPSITDRRSDDPIKRYGRLLFELSDVIDSVQGDRRLAMYRAHQHGMELAEIARHAHVEIDEVQDVIDTLSRESEVEEWRIAGWAPRCGS